MPAISRRPRHIHVYVQLSAQSPTVIGVLRWELNVHGTIVAGARIEVRPGYIYQRDLQLAFLSSPLLVSTHFTVIGGLPVRS